MAELNAIFPAKIVSIQGKPYMFTTARVKREMDPNLFIYEIRDEKSGEFWQIQHSISGRRYGTIIGREPLDISPEGLKAKGTFIGVTVGDIKSYNEAFSFIKDYASWKGEN